MARYKVLVDDIYFPHASVDYNRDYSLKPQHFEVILKTLETIPNYAVVKIYRNGALDFQGKVYKSGKVADLASGVGTILQGYSLERKCGVLSVVNLVENADPATQISNNLPNSDLTAGTINNYGSAIVMAYGSKDEAAFSRQRFFGEICFVTGWEIYRSPAGILDFKNQCGTDKSATVIFKRGENLKQYVEPYLVNSFNKVKKVMVVGAQSGEFTYAGITQAGDYQDGDPRKNFDRKNLINDDTCQKASASVYADFQNDLKTTKISVEDEGLSYDIFDTVKVVDKLLLIDEPLRVYHIHRRSDEKGEENELSLANISKLNCNGPLLLDAAESYLDAASRLGEDFAKTEQPISRVAVVTELPAEGDVGRHVLLDAGEAGKKEYYDIGSKWRLIDPSGAWDEDESPVRMLTHNPQSRAWFGSGQDGVVTITEDTDLGDDSLKFYKALVVNAGVTLSGNSPMFIFVQQELVLEGTIKVNPGIKGGGGGGAGGGGAGAKGGGTLYLYAAKISGTGKVQANGEVGVNGITSTTANPSDGGAGAGTSIEETSFAGAGGGKKGTVSLVGLGGAKGSKAPAADFKRWKNRCISDYGLFSVSANRIVYAGGSGGGGGGQYYNYLNSRVYGGGGGGGGSLFTDGGDGGQGGYPDTTSDSPSSGGGGGGGGAGGVIFLVCPNIAETVDIEAKGGDGGDGGDGLGAGGGGGGGGGPGSGGYVLCLTNVLPINVDLSEGTPGDPGEGGVGGQGQAANEGSKLDYPSSTFSETPTKIVCPCCLGTKKKWKCSVCGGAFCKSLQQCPVCGKWEIIPHILDCTLCNGTGEVDRG